jgi:hypothetical protein
MEENQLGTQFSKYPQSSRAVRQVGRYRPLDIADWLAGAELVEPEWVPIKKGGYARHGFARHGFAQQGKKLRKYQLEVPSDAIRRDRPVNPLRMQLDKQQSILKQVEENRPSIGSTTYVPEPMKQGFRIAQQYKELEDKALLIADKAAMTLPIPLVGETVGVVGAGIRGARALRDVQNGNYGSALLNVGEAVAGAAGVRIPKLLNPGRAIGAFSSGELKPSIKLASSNKESLGLFGRRRSVQEVIHPDGRDWLTSWMNNPKTKNKIKDLGHPNRIYSFDGQLEQNGLRHTPITDASGVEEGNYRDLFRERGVNEYLKYILTTKGISYKQPPKTYLNGLFATMNNSSKNFQSTRVHELAHQTNNNGISFTPVEDNALIEPLGLGLKKLKAIDKGFIKQVFKKLKLSNPATNLPRETERIAHELELLKIRKETPNKSLQLGTEAFRKQYLDESGEPHHEFLSRLVKLNPHRQRQMIDRTKRSILHFLDQNHPILDEYKAKGQPVAGLAVYDHPDPAIRNKAFLVDDPEFGYHDDQTGIEELTHHLTTGGSDFKPEDIQLLKAPFYQSIDELNGLFNPDAKDYVQHQMTYLLDPTEIHAKVNRLRYLMNPNDRWKPWTNQDVSDLLREKNELEPDLLNFTQFVKHSSKFEDLLNKMWAFPAAGVVGATKLDHVDK